MAKICKHCGTSNAILKKCCSNCNKPLEGPAINNMSGKVGYRNADGSFTVDDTAKLTDEELELLKHVQ